MRAVSPPGAVTVAASGKLLRGATDADRQAEEESLRRSAELFEEGRALLHDLGLPVTLLDAQLLLDARHLVLQVLAPAGADLGPLAAASFLATVPSLLFFALLQRRLASGMIAGAVKG